MWYYPLQVILRTLFALNETDTIGVFFQSEDLGDLGDLGDLTDFLTSDSNEQNTDSGCSSAGTAVSGGSDSGCMADFSSSSAGGSDNLFEGLGDIKADIMFSSTMEDMFGSAAASARAARSNKRRNRDVSVTLSECAEGMLALKDMELLLDGTDGKDPKYGVSPTFGNSFTFMDTPLASEESDAETDNNESSSSDEDDEEIDVVSEEVASSSRTRVHTPKRKANGQHVTTPPAKKATTVARPPIKAGRSLLKARQVPATIPAVSSQAPKPKLAVETASQPSIDHFNGDHSYFLARPTPISTDLGSSHSQGAGVLTPSESGEDTDNNGYTSSTSVGGYHHGYNTLASPAEVDKNKIVAAVQALAQKAPRGRQDSGASDGVKFRFKMRFKSNSPQRASQVHREQGHVQQSAQRSLLISQPRNLATPIQASTEHHQRIRRKSASRNSYCPTPATDDEASSIVATPVSHHHQSVLSAAAVNPLSAGGQTTVRQIHTSVKLSRAEGVNTSGSSRTSSSHQSSHSSSSSSKRSSSEDKCREIRDLHNRMERQRRVDLKNNYDQLKDCVPALVDVDKASKLNILNKAADYCRLLIASDQKLKKEVDRETVRNAQLRKRLQQLVEQHNFQRKTSSGRTVTAKRFD